MRPWTDYTEVFLSLVVITNPLGYVPLYIAMTRGMSDAQVRRLATVASLTVVVVLTAAIFVGEPLFRAFSISIPSFRVAGGILIMMTALAMARAPVEAEDPDHVPHGGNVGVVPLGMPLLAGPGAMTALMIQAHEFESGADNTVLTALVLADAVLCWLCIVLARPLERVLGPQGINIVSRVAGLLLAALAVEFVASGLRDLFPMLGQR